MFPPDSDKMKFSLKKAMFWRTKERDRGLPILARNNGLKLKHPNDEFVYYKHSLFRWIIVMFLSAVWTLILTAPIHYRWSISEQIMSC